MAKKNLIVLSSPSGGGKSTIARRLMEEFNNLKFSISATTRAKRPREKENVDYYFLSKSEFEKKIEAGELVEYEQIFGNYYGTLKSEIDEAIDSGKCLLFDVDVNGAESLKKAYPDDSLLIFLAPPNIDALRKRLKRRGDETEEQIETRIARAESEIAKKKIFDFVVINDDLKLAINEVLSIVGTNCAVE